MHYESTSLVEAIFSNSELRRAKFNLANLEVAGADLAEADLKGSDLDRAILAEPIQKIDKHLENFLL